MAKSQSKAGKAREAAAKVAANGNVHISNWPSAEWCFAIEGDGAFGHGDLPEGWVIIKAERHGNLTHFWIGPSDY